MIERADVERAAAQFRAPESSFGRLVRRRNRKRRNRRITTGVVAILIAAVAITSGLTIFRAALEIQPATPTLIPPSVKWTRNFGDGEGTGLTGVAADDSAIYVTGFAAKPLPGETVAGMFVRRYSDGGEVVWTRQFGGDAGSIAVDPSGVYVVGGSWVRKLDAAGNDLWKTPIRNAPTGETDGDAIVVGADGIYVSGCPFVEKLDPSGDLLWKRRFGESACGTDLALDQTQLYAVSDTADRSGERWVLRAYTTEGKVQWTRILEVGPSNFPYAYLAVDGTGISLLTAGRDCMNLISETRCLLRYGAGGRLEDSSPVGSGNPRADYFPGDMAPSTNGLVVAGKFREAFVNLIDARGQTVWTVQLPSEQYPWALAVDADNVYVVGFTPAEGNSSSASIVRLG